MRRRSLCHPVLFTLLGGALICVSACSRQPPPPPEAETSGTIRGKVTYDGKPVPYGYVLFYNLEKSFDSKAKGLVATGFGPIAEDGSYQVGGVPLGAMKVCVVTDPDVDPATLFGPRSPGGDVLGPGGPPPGGPPGGPASPASHPGGGHGPGVRPNPRVQKLEPEVIQMLRDINTRYGTFAASPLGYFARTGDQTFDLELKSSDRKATTKPPQ